jgi:hypothetical protein
LLTDPGMAADLAARWSALEPAALAVAASIQPRAEALAPALANDGLRWGSPGRVSDSPAYLQNWLETRIAWINSQVGAPGAP